MLVIIITAAILAIGIILAILNEKYWEIDGILLTSFLCICGSSIAILIETICLSFCYCGLEGQISAKAIERESLVYQLENKVYDNDNDIGKKELYSEIQDYNTSLAAGKILMNNAWIGIFYPREKYENFDFINLEDYDAD